MGIFYLDAGRLHVETTLRQIGPDHHVREIVNVVWEGAPFAPIEEELIRRLPAWARSGDDLVQIGPYVLRRTKDFHYALNGHYWNVIGRGEWHMAVWRVMCALERTWRRLLMTLAVWGLASWPRGGGVPTWADVLHRWRGNDEGRQ